MERTNSIIQLYSSIVNATSTEQIKHSETALDAAIRTHDFITINIDIIATTALNNHIRTLAAISLVKNTKITQNIQAINDYAAMFQRLINLIANPLLDHQLKSITLQAIENFLNHASTKHLKTNLMKQLQASLKSAVAHHSQGINFEMLIYLGHALFNKFTTEDQAQFLISNTLAQYSIMGHKLHVMLSTMGQCQDKNVIKILQVIIEYSKLLKKYLNRIDLLPLSIIHVLLYKQWQPLIATALQITIHNYPSTSSLYTHLPQQSIIAAHLNTAKKNYISILNKFIKIFVANYKDAATRSKSSLFSKTPQILTFCVGQTSAILKSQPVHKYQTQSQIPSLLFECISLIITCLNVADFYDLFLNLRSQLIQQILLPCLHLSPGDVDDFYQDSIQFIQKTIQIVEKDLMPKGQSQRTKTKQNEDEIQLYETIKTSSAHCLNILCKYQDGLLSYLIDFIINSFQGKVSTNVPKIVLLLILAILKNHLYQRKDLQLKLSNLIDQLLQFQTPAFDPNQRFQRDIQYAYVLLVISKVVPEIIEVAPEILSKASKKGIQILSDERNPDVYKYFMFQFFDELNILENGQLFALDIIFIYNKLIRSWNTLSLKLLDSYYLLLEYNIPFFKLHSGPVLQGLTIFCLHIQKQLQKPSPVQLIINKSFNIVRLVGQSPEFITEEHIRHIEQIMIPFLPYVDGIKDVDIEEDILLLLTSFIRHGKNVTNNQKIMFQVIPNIFYNQYKCHFGHALETINTFIYYGSNTLEQAPKALQIIVEMALTNITQKMVKGRPLSDLDNCQGVLILQSLVLACGHFMTVETWTLILQKAVNRLMQNIESTILTANLIGLICLALTKTQNIFPDQQNEILLTRVLSSAPSCCYTKWTKKILVTGLSQLLLSYQKPFISRRFTQILDIIVSTLSASANSAQKSSKQYSEDPSLQQFQTILELIENNLKKIDQYSFFKMTLNKIKMSEPQLLKGSFQGFSQQKKDYLNRIFLTERVVNQNRTIFKIKK